MRIAVVTAPAQGHFRPLLPLLAELGRRGHDLLVVGAEEFQDTIRAAGFAATSAGLDDRRSIIAAHLPELESLTGEALADFMHEKVFAGLMADHVAADALPALREWGPDLVLHEESSYGAPILAAQLGVPWVSHGVGPVAPLEMVERGGVAAAALWRARGLTPPRWGGLFHALHFEVMPPALRPDDGPVHGVAHELLTVSVGAPDREPTDCVYVSLGTIWNSDLDRFRTIVLGAADADLDVIVSLGGRHEPSALGELPGRVRLEPWIDEQQVLPRVRAVVTHGGAGTLLSTLGHGVPLVMCPLGADQFWNSERGTEVGLAKALLPDDVTREAVAQAVSAVSEGASYSSAAQAVREELRAMPGPSPAADRLEALVGGG